MLGVSVSQQGLEAGIALLIKGTLGVFASLTLAATTEPQALLAGLERLHLPQQLVQIMAFMVRYLDVVTGEMQRMKVARESRGFTARNPKHWPVLARSAGALFIRSYERGERVHLAMLSRGYTGTMPAIHDIGADRGQWATAAALPVLAVLVTAYIFAAIPLEERDLLSHFGERYARYRRDVGGLVPRFARRADAPAVGVAEAG